MIDDSELTELLFGIKGKKKSKQTKWNEETMFEKETKQEKSAREIVEEELKVQKPIPVDKDDTTMIDTKKNRLTRKLTYGKEKVIPISQYMEKLREQYLMIYKQPKWAEIDESFNTDLPPDIQCLYSHYYL